MKTKWNLTPLIMIVIIFWRSPDAMAKVSVVTTTEDLASITRSVGGDFVEVSAIAKGTQDPHYIEAKPSYCVKMNRADLVLSIGLDLESAWLPLLLRMSRKPDLMPGNRGYLEVSEAITPIEVGGKTDRSEGDVHPYGNPHFMGDPERALAVAERISKKLAEIDQINGGKYQENYKAFEKGMRAKIAAWKSKLAKHSGMNLVGYHKTFNYFFNYFNLNPVGYVEPKPGIPPTAQHIVRLVDITKTKKAKLIVMENFFDPKPVQTLSQQTGVPFSILPPNVGGDEKSPTYEAWMDTLVAAFEGKAVL